MDIVDCNEFHVLGFDIHITTRGQVGPLQLDGVGGIHRQIFARADGRALVFCVQRTVGSDAALHEVQLVLARDRGLCRGSGRGVHARIAGPRLGLCLGFCFRFVGGAGHQADRGAGCGAGAGRLVLGCQQVHVLCVNRRISACFDRRALQCHVIARINREVTAKIEARTHMLQVCGLGRGGGARTERQSGGTGARGLCRSASRGAGRSRRFCLA